MNTDKKYMDFNDLNKKVSFPISLTVILILSGLLVAEIVILLKSLPA